jgi:uncharacterized membrane protein
MAKAHDAGQALHVNGARVSSATRSLLTTTIILGIGIAGTLDEIVLHQLLQWHNFYVHTTTYRRIVSDGLFHLVSSTLLLVGALLLCQRRRLFSQADWRAIPAGICLGAGGFNLYDGTIHHKVLQIHPVREGVANILPYDLAFNGIALALLIVGWLIWRRIRVQGVGSG